VQPSCLVVEGQDVETRGQLGDPENPLVHRSEFGAEDPFTPVEELGIVDGHEAVVGHPTYCRAAAQRAAVSGLSVRGWAPCSVTTRCTTARLTSTPRAISRRL
jgi:hypothetical protein